MGTHTPSRLRREGRNAFEPYVDSMDVNPYLHKTDFYAANDAANWLDGWNEAKDAWEAEQKETNLSVVDQNQCDHVVGFSYYYEDIQESKLSMEQTLKENRPLTWYDCDFCPRCGKDIRNA